jgi:hypothetical protein
LHIDAIQYFIIEKIHLTKNGQVLLAVTTVEAVPVASLTLSLIADRAGKGGPLPQVAAGAGVTCLAK